MDATVIRAIRRLQENLLVIRRIAGWSTSDLGDLIGVTKATISNLENKKTQMTKTQYLAIRTVIDFEISSNPDNIALAQVVNLLLDTDNLTEDDEKKVKDAMAFVSGAAEKGVDNTVILAGMTALLSALGCAITAPLTLGFTSVWIGKLMGTKQSKAQKTRAKPNTTTSIVKEVERS